MIRKILAPNPSIYTGPGTNTYLVSDGNEVAIVDPGPVIPSHELEIIAAVEDLTKVPDKTEIPLILKCKLVQDQTVYGGIDYVRIQKPGGAKEK